MRKTNVEVLDHSSEVTAVAIKQDGKELAVCTLKGEVYIWDIEMS